MTDCTHIRNNGTCRIFNTPCVPCNLQKTEYESRMHTMQVAEERDGLFCGKECKSLRPMQNKTTKV